MATLTSWMVGSITLSSAATLTINAADQDVAAGTYYLRDATDSRSLIKQVEDAIAAEVAGATVYIGQDRKVRIDFNGAATNITIPSTLREALGFTSASYGPVDSLTAEDVSNLLWSAGWPETTNNSPVGIAGRKVYDRVITSSPTGQTFNVTLHHSMTMADWSWRAVRPERAWTSDEAPGEFVRFFEDVIVPGKRMKLYSQISEDDASASAVTWTTGLGPYIVPVPNYDWYQRFVAATDALGANIDIEAMQTSEAS